MSCLCWRNACGNLNVRFDPIFVKLKWGIYGNILYRFVKIMMLLR